MSVIVGANGSGKNIDFRRVAIALSTMFVKWMVYLVGVSTKARHT